MFIVWVSSWLKYRFLIALYSFQGYRPCAQRASILFFVLNDMGRIDPMYQFSLDSYISLFNSSIEKSQRSPQLEIRIHNLNEYHTYSVYKYVLLIIVRRLFGEDHWHGRAKYCERKLRGDETRRNNVGFSIKYILSSRNQIVKKCSYQVFRLGIQPMHGPGIVRWSVLIDWEDYGRRWELDHKFITCMTRW